MKLLSRFAFLCSEVWKNISLGKKKLFYIYILISVIITIIDFLSITSLMNIVGYATNNEIISREKISILININKYSDKSLFIFLSILFLSITAISIVFRYIHGLINAKISHGVIYEFNQIIFKKLVYLNLLNNKNVNINSVTANLSKIEDIRYAIIYSLTAISSTIITIGILITLLFIDIKITFFSLLFFITIYLLIIFSIKKAISKNSKDVSENIELKVHTLSSLMNNMRSVIIDNLQFSFLKNFSDYDFKITKARISLSVVSFLPAIVIINLVFIILVGYLFFLVVNGYDFLTDVGKIVAIAFGVQKLNPLINSIYVAISRTGGSYYNIESVMNFISLIKKKSNQTVLTKIRGDQSESSNLHKIKFKKTLKLEKIDFKYDTNQNLIKGLNLTINKNDKIIILGESGSGKSTFLDILTGLIKPDKGTIKLDNIKIDQKNLKAYQKKISLITQNIFLEEGTLLKNITNTNKNSNIDFKHLKKCCEISEISNFIKQNKNKYEMYISHNGSNLSGGQKQRIAIAKALYRNSDILIFDEITSEIDIKIEKKILNNFSKYVKNKTIILVTHKTQKNNFFNKRFILIGNKLKKI
jgi:ABC-type bacteriocin/lantibiotic exporter with double-glycine peptidase domain